MKLPFRRRHRHAHDTCRGPDPSVQVVHDALAFATAAIGADASQFRAIADDALTTDAIGFLDALATTVSVIAEEADEHGADVRTALREIALGVHIAAMTEAGATPRGTGLDHRDGPDPHPDPHPDLHHDPHTDPHPDRDDLEY